MVRSGGTGRPGCEESGDDLRRDGAAAEAIALVLWCFGVMQRRQEKRGEQLGQAEAL